MRSREAHSSAVVIAGHGESAYLPRALLSELAAHPDRSVPWAASIDGTLVMADISGFTALSERLAAAGREGAERLTDIINSFFSTMLDIANAHGGDALTFGGDAVLVLFCGEGHAARAVHAGLAMLEATDAVPTVRVGGGRVKLGMSMGAHTGRFPFVACGTQIRAQFIAIGPEPSRTATAEAVAERGQLVVTHSTLVQLGEGADVRPIAGGMWHVCSTGRSLAPWEDSGAVDHPTANADAFVPSFVTEALSDHEAAISLEGEHRTVTVVFINVTNVDTLIRRAGHEGAMEELQTYVSHVLDSADRHGGYVVSNDIATDGFKLIVAFGVPVAREHDAQNAARFSLAVDRLLKEAALNLTHKMGLHRASVYAGDVGSKGRRQYTIMGDGVNLAARIMARAECGTILSSGELVSRLGPSFCCTDLGSVTVKGKTAPIPICQLEAEDAESSHTLERESPFVGRDAEMRRLWEAIELADAGEGQLVLLSGEAGIGKSRVLEEFLRRAAADGRRVIAGRCYEHMSGTPFSPWRPILSRVLKLDSCADGAARGKTLRERFDALLPYLADYAPLLGPLLDADISETKATASMTPEGRLREIFRLVVSVLRAEAKRSEIVISIEDVHWADESSRELLQDVAQDALEGMPILLVVTARPDHMPHFEVEDHRTTSVELSALPSEAAAQIVEHASGYKCVPEHVAQLLVEKTAGNPFFLEEMVRSVSDSGLLDRLRDSSSVAASRELAGFEFPDQVETLIMSRIDTLDRSLKDALRSAAVIGQVFDDATLSMLRGSDDSDQTAHDAARLEDLDLFIADRSDCAQERTYRFRHALVQEVAYASLRFDRRRDMHHQVACYLEKRWNSDVDPHVDEITRHYSMSGDLAKTREFAVLAADRARRMYAHRESIDYCLLALHAERRRSTDAVLAKSGLAERIGDGYQIIGRHKEAIASYRAALERWSRIERRLTQPGHSGHSVPLAVPEDSRILAQRYAVICHKMAMCYERQARRYDLADRWVSEGLEHLPRGSGSLRAWMYTTRGISLRRQGLLADALAWSKRAVVCARRAKDDSGLAWALNQVSVLYSDAGNTRKGVETQREAVTILERIGELERLTIAYTNLAYCLMQRGDLAEARAANERALELETRLGWTDRITVSHTNIGEIEVVLGHYEEAIDHLVLALEAATRANSHALAGFILANLSRAHAGLGDLDTAKECIDRSIVLLKRAGARSVLAEAKVQAASVTRRQGKTSAAITMAEQAREELMRRGNKIACVRAIRVKARAEADLGHYEVALEHINDSVKLAHEVGAAAELMLSQRVQARLVDRARLATLP